MYLKSGQFFSPLESTMRFGYTKQEQKKNLKKVIADFAFFYFFIDGTSLLLGNFGKMAIYQPVSQKLIK
jgi:hypothetical protein